MLSMPEWLESKLEELYEICEQNPEYLTIKVVSNYLHVKPDGIRDSIDRGQCPFGFSWKLGENAAYKIPTVKFFLWITNSGVTLPMGNRKGA